MKHRIRPLVYICSPYAGDEQVHKEKVRYFTEYKREVTE